MKCADCAVCQRVVPNISISLGYKIMFSEGFIRARPVVQPGGIPRDPGICYAVLPVPKAVGPLAVDDDQLLRYNPWIMLSMVGVDW